MGNSNFGVRCRRSDAVIVVRRGKHTHTFSFRFAWPSYLTKGLEITAEYPKKGKTFADGVKTNEISITGFYGIPLYIQEEALAGKCPAFGDGEDDDVIVELTRKVRAGCGKLLCKREPVMPRHEIRLSRRRLFSRKSGCVPRLLNRKGHFGGLCPDVVCAPVEGRLACACIRRR